MEEKITEIMEFITKETKVINPVINYEKNTLSYPFLSHIGDDAYISSLLERLASPELNVLEKGVSERVLVCPVHPQYLATSLRLYCPKCTSDDIVKLHLMEHTPCGYIFERKEMGDNSSNMCPFCKHSIKELGEEIKKLGRWYECNKCKARFDDCITRLCCRNFNHDFEVNQAITIAIPNYRLKAEAKTLQVYTSLLPQIKNLLASAGFAVEESFNVKGRSGCEHMTDIFAYDNKHRTVIIDIASSQANVSNDKVQSQTNVSDDKINSMIVKVLDASPTMAIFIGIPSVSNMVKAIAEQHGIFVITGADFAEIIHNFYRVFKTHLKIQEIE